MILAFLEFLTGALWKKKMTKRMRISFNSINQFMGGIDPVCSPANASCKPSCKPAGVRKLSDFVYLLYEPEGEPAFDILLVHGLVPRKCNYAYWKTWSPDGGKTIWPQTALSKRFPNARIISLSYEPDACPESDEMRSCTGNYDCYVETWMSDVGSKLADNAIFNARVGQRPLVIIAHSVGGLVVKQMIVSTWGKECQNKCNRCNEGGKERCDKCIAVSGNERSEFLHNIRGVFYFATPHTGSFMADSACKILGSSSSPILHILKTRSAARNSLINDFSRVQERLGISEFSVMEGCETKFGKVSVTVGLMESAASEVESLYALDTDHFTVCKKVEENSTAFERLVCFIENDCKIGGGSSATHMSKQITTGYKFRRRT